MPHTPQPAAAVLQDIAVVPFLVLLPLVESNAFGGGSPVSLLKALGPTALTTVGSLGLLLVCGRIFLRRIFELVAAARSDETFVALCLLTVTGASLTTQVSRWCVPICTKHAGYRFDAMGRTWGQSRLNR